MGMSVFVYAIKPADEKHEKMRAAWEACKAAKVPVPREVEKYFCDAPPDPRGVVVYLPLTDEAITVYSPDACQDRFDVDLSKLDKDVKILRFEIAY